VVEDPSDAGWEVGSCDGVVEATVHVEANRLRFPLDGKKVEVIGESMAAWQSEGAGDASSTGVAWSVDGAVNGEGLAADVLEDVDLTAVRPTRASSKPATVLDRRGS